MDKEVEEAQPWVQSLYSGLVPDVALGLMWGYVNAEKKRNAVNWPADMIRDGGEIYADHYLKLTEWALSYNMNRCRIDSTKYWAFKDKQKWDVSTTNTAPVQYHRSSSSKVI